MTRETEQLNAYKFSCEPCQRVWVLYTLTEIPDWDKARCPFCYRHTGIPAQ